MSEQDVRPHLCGEKPLFSIGRGEVFGLLGPNGAGKTTTIKMLTLLARPTSGDATIDGLNIVSDKKAIKQCISVVPQENNIDRELTAHENLLIYSMLHSVPDREAKIRTSLELVDLWDRHDDVVSKFSGGMQRRLLIARALLAEPSVLFLDEPSIGLDPQIRRQMWDIIRKTRIDGGTVLITTHYIEEAEALCDRDRYSFERLAYRAGYTGEPQGSGWRIYRGACERRRENDSADL